jgi:hypothetical protein
MIRAYLPAAGQDVRDPQTRFLRALFVIFSVPVYHADSRKMPRHEVSTTCIRRWVDTHQVAQTLVCDSSE